MKLYTVKKNLLSALATYGEMLNTTGTVWCRFTIWEQEPFLPSALRRWIKITMEVIDCEQEDYLLYSHCPVHLQRSHELPELKIPYGKENKVLFDGNSFRYSSDQPNKHKLPWEVTNMKINFKKNMAEALAQYGEMLNANGEV